MSSELEEHLWRYHQGKKVDLSALKKSAAESLGLEFGAKDSMVCVVSQICHVQSTTLPSSLSAGVIPLPPAAEIITVNPKCAWQHSGLYVELDTMSMDLPVESVEVRSILLYMLKFTIFVDSPENDAYILSLSTSLSSTQPIPSMQSIPTMSSTPPNTTRNTDSKQNFITTIENFHSMHTSANSQWIIIKNMLKCSKLPIQTWCSLSGYIYLQVDKASFFLKLNTIIDDYPVRCCFGEDTTQPFQCCLCKAHPHIPTRLPVAPSNTPGDGIWGGVNPP